MHKGDSALLSESWVLERLEHVTGDSGIVSEIESKFRFNLMPAFKELTVKDTSPPHTIHTLTHTGYQEMEYLVNVALKL